MPTPSLPGGPPVYPDHHEPSASVRLDQPARRAWPQLSTDRVPGPIQQPPGSQAYSAPRASPPAPLQIKMPPPVKPMETRPYQGILSTSEIERRGDLGKNVQSTSFSSLPSPTSPTLVREAMPVSPAMGNQSFHGQNGPSLQYPPPRQLYSLPSPSREGGVSSAMPSSSVDPASLQCRTPFEQQMHQIQHPRGFVNVSSYLHVASPHRGVQYHTPRVNDHPSTLSTIPSSPIPPFPAMYSLPCPSPQSTTFLPATGDFPNPMDTYLQQNSMNVLHSLLPPMGPRSPRINVKDFTLNELRPYFNKPMAVVAKELGVCITLMKKICRRNGLVRWPHRRIRSLVNRITSLQVIASNSSEVERGRFVAQINALREELSAVIDNPNEKSRKALADAKARSPSSAEAREKLLSATEDDENEDLNDDDAEDKSETVATSCNRQCSSAQAASAASEDKTSSMAGPSHLRIPRSHGTEEGSDQTERPSGSSAPSPAYRRGSISSILCDPND